MDGEKEETEEGVRSFTRMLDGVNYGQAQTDLSIEFNELCLKLRAQARRHDAVATGHMDVKVNISVNGRGEIQMAVDSKNTVKKPKTDASSAWMTEGGNVVFESPRQLGLGLREVVDEDTGEIKEVPDNNGGES